MKKIKGCFLVIAWLCGGICLSSGQEAHPFSSRVLELINQARVAEGLVPLRSHPFLNRFATEWAARMGKKNVLEHRSRADLRQAMCQQGFARINENIYYASAKTSPERIVQQWLNSPGHRRNLLNPNIREAGVGVVHTQDGRWYAAFNGARALDENAGSRGEIRPSLVPPVQSKPGAWRTLRR